ncbi:uncharacterized protein LOC144113400 isoform X1 [Amblyomma americanum]
MSQVVLAGFRPIKGTEEYFHPASLTSGKKLYDAGHVSFVTEVDGVNVRAKCRSQQGKQVYDVSLHINKNDRELQAGLCSCRYGAAGSCKHCAAVALHVNMHDDISCTSERQRWGRPSKKARVDDKASIEELFGANKHPHVGGGEPPKPLDPSFLIKHFPDIQCPMSRILKAQNENDESACKTVLQDIIDKVLLEEEIEKLRSLLQEPKKALHSLMVTAKFPKILIKKKEYEEEMPAEVAAYYAKNIKCLSALHLCALTKGQANNHRWHRERRLRITCSQAHMILRTRKPPQDLLKTILHRRGFCSEATSYGTFSNITTSHVGLTESYFSGMKMEPVARKNFEEKVCADVLETGLVVHTAQPWLCGSPDGLFETAKGVCLLEIKCPFSRRNRDIIDVDQEITFVPYIKYKNGKLTLLASHRYYTQVQLLMYVCNLNECFFLFILNNKASPSL